MFLYELRSKPLFETILLKMLHFFGNCKQLTVMDYICLLVSHEKI